MTTSTKSPVRRRDLAGWLCALAGVLTTSPVSAYSTYYDYKTVAVASASATGTNLVSIDPNVSLNNSGLVALIGRFKEGGTGPLVPHIYVSHGEPEALHDASPIITSTYSQDLGPALQINNQNQILTRHYWQFPLNSLAYDLELWDGLGVNSRTVVVSGSVIGGQFDATYGYGSVNDLGNLAFNGFDAGTNYIATLVGGAGVRAPLATELPNPMMSEKNTFVMNGANQTIRVRNPDILTNALIASAAVGSFNSVGRRPGISDDGTVVAFFGDQAGAQGIFVSVDTTGSGGWSSPTRVAGFSYAELGSFVNGSTVTPIRFSATGYDPDSRVSVTNRVEGSFEVSFIATPDHASQTNPHTGQPWTFSAAKGLWTVRVDVDTPLDGSAHPLLLHVVSPIPVAQVGDVVGPMDERILDIKAPFDGLALAVSDEYGTTTRPQQRRGDHRVAFWCSTNAANERVIRASHLDSDQDGLCDHWEAGPSDPQWITHGVDADRDRVGDLALAAIGASVTGRDLFLEADWLSDLQSPEHVVIRPRPEAFNRLRIMFANAPTPIALHVDAGDASERGVYSNLPPGSALYGGEISTPARVICVNAFDPNPAMRCEAGSINFGDLKALWFGLDPAHPSLDHGAREFAFHYCIFGYDQAVSGGAAGSGLSEGLRIDSGHFVDAPTNDFVVALRGTTSLSAMPAWYRQFSTMAHELGHNLGLRHGGFDDAIMHGPRDAGVFDLALYRPNYVSVMNYTYALDGLKGLTGFGGASANGICDPLSPRILEDAAGNVANVAGLKIITRGVLPYGSDQERTIVSNDNECILIDQPWTTIPAGCSSVLCSSFHVATYDYTRGPAHVFDDWQHIKMDFPTNLRTLGTTVGAGFAAAPPWMDESGLGPPSLGAGPSIPPSVTIVKPDSGATIAAGASLAVRVRATDDAAIASVVVLFDLNGNGTIEPATERVVATPVGADSFQVSIGPVQGPVGARVITTLVKDTDEGYEATNYRTVNVSSSVSVPTPSPSGPLVELAAPSPNPTLGKVTITFSLPARDRVGLTVYDVGGRVVRRLVDAEFDAGPHSVTWYGFQESGAKAAPGIYLVTLNTAAGKSLTRKLVLLDK